MTTSDSDMAMQLNAKMHHNFNCLQQLVMRMADYRKDKNAWNWWGKKKSIKEWMEFGAALKKIAVAMFLDGIIDRDAPSNEVENSIYSCIGKFSELFPNWQDAYSFANIFFVHPSNRATYLISELRP